MSEAEARGLWDEVIHYLKLSGVGGVGLYAFEKWLKQPLTDALGQFFGSYATAGVKLTAGALIKFLVGRFAPQYEEYGFAAGVSVGAGGIYDILAATIGLSPAVPMAGQQAQAPVTLSPTQQLVSYSR